MATLVNIHEHREPMIPAMPKLTTGSLGLLTRAINMSRTVNSTDLGPDEFNNMSFDNNMDTWWLALPTELYSAITPETGLPTTLGGNTMCPRWDKLTMSPAPSTTPQSCTLKATTGNKPNCLHCAPTASNRRDASEVAQSTSSTVQHGNTNAS